MIVSIAEKYAKFYTAQNITWNIKTEKQKFTLHTNQYLLENLLNNAIQNAFKHNIKNGRIAITLNNNKILIDNSGTPISTKDIQHVFEPFYKGENSKFVEGYGIGLSIMKKITDLLNYTVSLECKKDHISCTIDWNKVIKK